MRVTAVDLYSPTFTEAISFSLRDNDPTARYMVRNILGLDAEEITPKFYGFGLLTKPKYYEFGLKARDIVIRVVLNPQFIIDEEYSDVRDELYRAISATRTGQIVLHFRSGGTIVSRIFGFITKFEVPYFVRLPEVQLTIRCDDPMFRAINPVEFTTDDLPVANPIYIPDSLSTSPHGFSMQVTFTATSPSFTMQDDATTPEWKFKVTPSGGFLTGDVLYFSSDYTNKYLYMIRSGVTTYLVDKIEPSSIWPILFPGTNTFYILEIASIDWNILQFYAAYWGV